MFLPISQFFPSMDLFTLGFQVLLVLLAPSTYDHGSCHHAVLLIWPAASTCLVKAHFSLFVPLQINSHHCALHEVS